MIRNIFLGVVCLVIILSAAAVYVRYLVLEDFAVTTKPMEDFNNDDF